MRRPIADHTSQPWRVHDVARNFELLHVWRFPIRSNDRVPLPEFSVFLGEVLDRLRSGGGMAAVLFRLRAVLGRFFGWDEDPSQARSDVRVGFRPVYEDEFERLAEIENRTVHAFLHLGRVPLSDAGSSEGEWSPQMAIYAKPRGRLGRVYMVLIGPFRHWIVYPSMMRAVEHAWPDYARKKGWLDGC